jgi:hypothetical protein
MDEWRIIVHERTYERLWFGKFVLICGVPKSDAFSFQNSSFLDWLKFGSENLCEKVTDRSWLKRLIDGFVHSFIHSFIIENALRLEIGKELYVFQDLKLCLFFSLKLVWDLAGSTIAVWKLEWTGINFWRFRCDFFRTLRTNSWQKFTSAIDISSLHVSYLILWFQNHSSLYSRKTNPINLCQYGCRWFEIADSFKTSHCSRVSIRIIISLIQETTFPTLGKCHLCCGVNYQPPSA